MLLRKGISLLGLLLALLLAAQAAVADDAQTALPLVGVLEDGQAVYLRPLDDPANPYQGQYNAYDQWVYANRREVTPAELQEYYKSFSGQTEASNYHILAAQVDANGFVIPVELAMRKLGQARQIRTVSDIIGHQSHGLSAREEGLPIYATGDVPPELGLIPQELSYAMMAESYPPIPAWLGENPPLETIFVPNGEVLAYGALGLNFDLPADNSQMSKYKGQFWYRYSADGQLLGVYDLGPSCMPADWETIYWPERKAVTKQYREEAGPTLWSYGYTIFAENDDPKKFNDFGTLEATAIKAAFDYDGRPVDPAEVVTPGREACGSLTPAELVSQVYRQQILSGRSSTASRSPYEGTAQGPVLAGATPLPLPVVATSYGANSDGPILLPSPQAKPVTWVNVRPLDDPANPYRDGYGPWDAWMLANADAENPQREQLFLEQLHQREEIAMQAKAEDRALTEDEGKIFTLAHIAEHAPDDPWKNYYCAVNSDGWLIPQLDAHTDAPAMASDVRSTDWWGQVYPESTDMHFSASGLMPPELLEQWRLARLARAEATFPVIPDWLLNQPVSRVYFMPNGDVICDGQPGSYDPDTTKPRKERRAKSDGSLHRYNAAGVEVASLPGAVRLICALYDPAMLARWNEAEALGYQLSVAGGIYILRDKVSNEVMAAYDWDGTVLDHSQPILRAPNPNERWLDWDELVEMARFRGQLPAAE